MYEVRHYYKNHDKLVDKVVAYHIYSTHRTLWSAVWCARGLVREYNKIDKSLLKYKRFKNEKLAEEYALAILDDMNLITVIRR